jgi:hypothetical protein
MDALFRVKRGLSAYVSYLAAWLSCLLTQTINGASQIRPNRATVRTMQPICCAKSPEEVKTPEFSVVGKFEP